MLDFNSKESFSDRVNDKIDVALTTKSASETPRSYLGASRLGVECSRALQFEFQHAPKDEGREFSGKLLRIFAAGHLFEDLAIDWLRQAGFELHTEKPNAYQFGFSVAGGRIKGHVDGIITAAPTSLKLTFPCSGSASP